MANLFKINERLFEALENQFIVDDEGEIFEGEEFKQKLEDLKLEQAEKIEGYALYIQSIDKDVDLIKEKKKIINERLDRDIKALESKKQWLIGNLNATLQGEKFKSDYVAISYRKSHSVDILKPESIPMEFYRVKSEIDKALIKKALQGGINVEGAELKENQNIQIK